MSNEPTAHNAASERSPEPRNRRRGQRRATGGRVPDPNLAVDDPALFAGPGDPDRAQSGMTDALSQRDYERWLKEQRPPHWG